MTNIGHDTRLQRLAVLASQAWNVIWFDGWPDETVSGRAWRMREVCAIWAQRRKRIDRFFARLGDYDHCRKSHEKDVHFAKMILDTSSCPISTTVSVSEIS